MQDQIGNLAGKIWHLLGEKGPVPVSQLPKAVREPADLVSMSLGWLARENKIEFVTTVGRTKQASCTVALTEAERAAYEVAAKPASEPAST